MLNEAQPSCRCPSNTRPLRDAMSAPVDVERVLCEAIEQLRLVTFTLDGHRRIAEPHDYGVISGKRRLLFYQIAGTSRSGRPTPWRWADLDKISDIELLGRHFAGPRPAPSGGHHKWERIIASVSRPPSK